MITAKEYLLALMLFLVVLPCDCSLKVHICQFYQVSVSLVTAAENTVQPLSSFGLRDDLQCFAF